MRYDGFTSLKEKKQKEAEYEAKLAETLKKANKSVVKDTGAKRKDSLELLKYLDLKGMSGYMRNNPSDYRAKSYNLAKQIIGLIDFLFVKYRVPLFMYQAVLNESGMKQVFGGIDSVGIPDVQKWFIALAQGHPFQKLVASHLTKKEAHTFLFAPSGNSIRSNVFWAKCIVAEIPERFSDILVERLFDGISLNFVKTRDIIHFFSQYYYDMTKEEETEIIDFIRISALNDPTFSFKGRTLSSMIRLSNEWHAMRVKGKLGAKFSWNAKFTDWSYVEDHFVTAHELTDNHELANEGKKQRHCVWSYARYCSEGHCNIVSLRVFKKIVTGAEDGSTITVPGEEIDRVTIEVRNGIVYQAKRYANAFLDPRASRYLYLWKSAKGLR